MSNGRVRLSGGTAWQTDFRRRTTGRPVLSAMDIAMIRRSLNGTLTELQRAIDRFDVAKAADLFEWAWHQASQAPPRETREQRAQLRDLKEVLGSRRWREEERRLAAQKLTPRLVEGTPAPGRKPTKRPSSAQVPVVRSRTVWSSDTSRVNVPAPVQVPARRAQSAPAARDATPVPVTEALPVLKHVRASGYLEPGRLAELATDLRPLLEQTARAGTTTTWKAIRQRLPGLARLHRDDESVLLWLVDDERDQGILCCQPWSRWATGRCTRDSLPLLSSSALPPDAIRRSSAPPGATRS